MSWSKSSTPNKNFICICASSDGSIMYAGTADGLIYKSTDYGGSFPTSIQQGSNIIQILCNQSGTRIFALDFNKSVYYSTNSGATYSTFSSPLSFPFTYIAMTNNATPRLMAIVVNGTGYQSTNNTTWSLMLSGSSGPNSYICCGASVSSSVGDIYINHNNTDIYYSNTGTNGLSPFPTRPLKTTVNCGKVICAQSLSSTVMTINANNLNYNTTSGSVSYSTNTLINDIRDITTSYDSTIVTIIDISNNIYQSTSGPGSTFSVMSGYPNSLTFNSITSNSDGTILAATHTAGIYFFNLNATSYNFIGILSSSTWSGDVHFNLTINVNDSNIPASITSVSGTITYPSGSGLISPINIRFVSSGTNQLISNNSIPYFGTSGFDITDDDNSLDYTILGNGVNDAATNFGQGTINFTTESLTNSCLLKFTKILTIDGYKNIENISIGDIIISENDRQIKVKKIYRNKYMKIDKFMPCLIAKDFLGINQPFEDTYLTEYHAIKHNNKFVSPIKLGLKKVNIDDDLIYYHIELEDNGQNRRVNTIIANGLVVESYSKEKGL